MPFVYNLSSKAVADNFTTSGTTNTEVDQFFLKPGASRAVAFIALRVQGKANGATTLNGLAFRLKVYPTTASSGGTAMTPNPVDNRAPAAVATAGGASAGVTSGTGTPAIVGGCGCSGSGAGGWTAPNPDAGIVLDGGATKSMDLFSSAQGTSLPFEFFSEIQE